MKHFIALTHFGNEEQWICFENLHGEDKSVISRIKSSTFLKQFKSFQGNR